MVSCSNNAAPRLYLQTREKTEEEEAEDVLLPNQPFGTSLSEIEHQRRETRQQTEVENLNERLGAFSIMYDHNNIPIHLPQTSFVRLPTDSTVASLASKSAQQRDCIDFLKFKSNTVKQLFLIPTGEIRRLKSQEMDVSKEYEGRLDALSGGLRAFLGRVYKEIYEEEAYFNEMKRVNYNIKFQDIMLLIERGYLTGDGARKLLKEKCAIDEDLLTFSASAAPATMSEEEL